MHFSYGNIRDLHKQGDQKQKFDGKYDVIYLQETYINKTIENAWHAECGGDKFFSCGSKHGRGVRWWLPWGQL